jgi:hypothetical protein
MIRMTTILSLKICIRIAFSPIRTDSHTTAISPIRNSDYTEYIINKTTTFTHIGYQHFLVGNTEHSQTLRFRVVVTIVIISVMF